MTCAPSAGFHPPLGGRINRSELRSSVGICASELTRRLEEVYERVAKNDKLNSFLNDKLNAYFNGVSGVVEKLEEIVDKRLSDFDAAKTSWMLEQARRAACAFPVNARQRAAAAIALGSGPTVCFTPQEEVKRFIVQHLRDASKQVQDPRSTPGVPRDYPESPRESPESTREYP